MHNEPIEPEARQGSNIFVSVALLISRLASKRIKIGFNSVVWRSANLQQTLSACTRAHIPCAARTFRGFRSSVVGQVDAEKNNCCFNERRRRELKNFCTD